VKTRRLISDERLGFCHDCHNRARLEITFAHRTSIRLCDRCAHFLTNDLLAVTKPKTPTGK
jgi:hypothetical protein